MKTKAHYNLEWLIEYFESGAVLKFIYFWGHTNKLNEAFGKFCFSQWFECPFTINNLTYKTSEHWMMAHKALLFGDRTTFDKIINCEDPGEAKKLGRQVLNYKDEIWNKRKFEIVMAGNIHKFNQHPELAEYLLQTGDKILVEASPVDTIWGVGLSQDSEDIDNIYAWRGENLLGFALMEVRDFLKEFGHFRAVENAILPPWLNFPDIDPADMFWRMGQGEDYLKIFSNFYDMLTDKEKRIFKLMNPEPYHWTHFYE